MTDFELSETGVVDEIAEILYEAFDGGEKPDPAIPLVEPYYRLAEEIVETIQEYIDSNWEV
jgi:hypothetical protein